MKRINENIAYSKSILNKKGITTDSELYSDYLKIREICGRKSNIRDFHQLVIDNLKSDNKNIEVSDEPKS